MLRPTKEVKLPSGFTAHIATYMSYEDRQEIAKAVIKDTEIDENIVKDLESGDYKVKGIDAIDVEMTMVKRLTIRLINPDGGDENPAEIVNIEDTDIDALLAEIGKISPSKKKPLEQGESSKVSTAEGAEK
jgi:hypothetical protein